jgi:hypothetical protein
LVVAVGGLLVALGSLVVSILAWRRTGVLKTLDLRLRLRQESRVLGILLDGAVEMLANARRSHLAVLNMEGLSRSGNEVEFVREADADAAELQQLRENAQRDFGEIDAKIRDAELETKLVDARGVTTRVGQIREKYGAVLAQDDRKREVRRMEVAAHASQSLRS